MKILIKSVLLIAIVSTAHGQTAREYYAKALTAKKERDTINYYTNTLQAFNRNPYDSHILYECGIVATMQSKSDSAIQYLKRAILIDANLDLSIAEFTSLHKLNRFKKLLALQHELKRRLITSDTAFVVKDPTLHLESITCAGPNNTFYFGSIHKRNILQRNASGEVVNFTQPAQEGLTSVFGLKVDPLKKNLWACSSPIPQMEHYDTIAQSAVFKFDISSGALLKKYYPTSSKKTFLFGDLCLSTTGNAFVSDSQNNIIFLINEETDMMNEFFTSEKFWSLQGITLSHDDKYLFIADYIKGIFRLELSTKTLIQLTSSLELSLQGVDGLVFFKNSLIAVQNGLNPIRVVRYHLDFSLSKISEVEILDHRHPAFNDPTTGCLDGNSFYYIANSLWSGYDDHNNLKPPHELQEVVVLKNILLDD